MNYLTTGVDFILNDAHFTQRMTLRYTQIKGLKETITTLTMIY